MLGLVSDIALITVKSRYIISIWLKEEWIMLSPIFEMANRLPIEVECIRDKDPITHIFPIIYVDPGTESFWLALFGKL